MRSALKAFLCLSLIALIATPAAADEGRRYALVIGIGHYDSAAKLETLQADNDAGELGKELEKLGWRVRVMSTKGPGGLTPYKNNVLRQLGVEQTSDGVIKYVDNASSFISGLTTNDTLLVYYAGHGISEDGSDYLIPADATRDTASALTRSSLIRLSTVHEALKHSGAGRVLLITDACRTSGAVRGGGNPYNWRSNQLMGSNPDGKEVKLQVPPGTSFVELRSASNAESAREANTNGVFTGHLLNLLRNPSLQRQADKGKDGCVSPAEAFEYASLQTELEVEQKYSGDERQRPTMLTEGTSATNWHLSMCLINYGSKRVADGGPRSGPLIGSWTLSQSDQIASSDPRCPGGTAHTEATLSLVATADDPMVVSGTSRSHYVLRVPPGCRSTLNPGRSLWDANITASIELRTAPDGTGTGVGRILSCSGLGCDDMLRAITFTATLSGSTMQWTYDQGQPRSTWIRR